MIEEKGFNSSSGGCKMHNYHQSYLDGNWDNISRLILYGAGIEAKEKIKRIVNDFNVPFIVDQDEKKWGNCLYGVQIVSPDKLNEVKNNDKILLVIARRDHKAISDIKKVLSRYNLKENIDFCHISTFATEWYFKFKQQYCIFSVDIALTTACSLKCKNCNMFVRHYTRPVMYKYEEIVHSIDLFFNRIDYVFRLGFLGGEAILNPDLKRILEYTFNTYRHKIGRITVHTNGVLLLDKDLLKIIYKIDGLVLISDYTGVIGEKSCVNLLEQQLRDWDVDYGIMKNRIWCDTGFPEHPCQITDELARAHMLGCNGWRGLNDGKFYYCNISWSAEKAGLFKLSEGDYIDLASMEENSRKTKQKIYDFSLGNLPPNGYMSFCKVCGGCGPDNQDFVLAGEQVE